MANANALNNQNLSTFTIHPGNLVMDSTNTAGTTGIIQFGGSSGFRFISNFGTNNSFLGESSGNTTLSGTDNTGVGYQALNGNTIGSNNTAVGSGALTVNTASGNTAVGYQALLVNTTGISNVAIGSQTLLANTTGSFNTSIGNNTLAANTGGILNTAVGSSALQSNTTGIENTGVGTTALASCKTGSTNVAIGTASLQGLTTGSSNVAIGFNAGMNYSGGESTNICIGSGVTGTTGESSNIRIGTQGSITSCYIAGISGRTVTGVAVEVSTLGQLGVASSSREYKENIQDMGLSSKKIWELRPVSFQYKSDEEKRTQFGLIAEEVEEIFPDLVAYDEEGQPMSVLYQRLPVILLNELKGLKKDLDDRATGKKNTIENVAELGSISRRVLELHPVMFNHKSDPEKTTQYGLIAEEVAKVFPDLVVNNNVNYHQLTALLLGAIQNQQTVIEKLVKNVEKLENY